MTRFRRIGIAKLIIAVITMAFVALSYYGFAMLMAFFIGLISATDTYSEFSSYDRKWFSVSTVAFFIIMYFIHIMMVNKIADYLLAKWNKFGIPRNNR